MKYKKGNLVIEDNYPNNRSNYIKEGFEEVIEKSKSKPKTKSVKAE